MLLCRHITVSFFVLFLVFFVLLLEQAVWGNPVHAFRYIADIVLLIIYKT